MANISYKDFTLGVEEEYMVVDPITRELKSHEQKIVHEGQKIIKDKVKAEMHQAVVEVGTSICKDIQQAHEEISRLRRTVRSADLRETADSSAPPRGPLQSRWACPARYDNARRYRSHRAYVVQWPAASGAAAHCVVVHSRRGAHRR